MQGTIKIAAVMTTPRYECAWARSSIMQSLDACGIPLTVLGGVYYGQAMQKMLSATVASGAAFVLTVDFDSVFLPAHVQKLLHQICQRQDIDAIAPMQPMRLNGAPLATVEGGSVQWDGNPVKVDTAHFGLTIIRLSSLAKVPKPWFLGTPNADGEWGEGKTDDDVHFWRVWKGAGNSVFIDPSVRIGHLEEMVSVFDENMRLRHVYPQQIAGLMRESVT
jgi:hypothetical protein